ncbi:MAG TPA: pyridoxal 5'-phosphate synthase glutaminase subunit PdxT [Acidimicrobiales bacterium]
MTIGVLALQGDVREHAAALADLGEPARLVRRPSDLDGLVGIVLPGGESTTLSLLLESSGLFDPLAAVLGSGLPVLGTCAGMILLASDVLDGRPDQRRFNVIELTVRRNGYGRQRASFECDLDIDLDGVAGEPFHAVFIRAPVVEAYGPDVDVLAALPVVPDGPADPDGIGGAPSPVICRQGSVLVAAFHPELTEDRRLHRLFVDMTKEERR